jgi:hypothetical protein
MTYRVLLAIVAACLVSACHRDAAEDNTGHPWSSGRAGESGPIREVIAAAGVVTAAPGAELVMTAPETARIVTSRAEGDRAGSDLLVRFEIPSLTAGAASGQGAIEQAQARVENAKAAATRCGLFERGVAARKEVGRRA